VNKSLGIKSNGWSLSLNVIKTLVSKKKRRFVQDGYNLDLSCKIISSFKLITIDITPSLIAMGYPGEGLDKLYRNSMSDVQSFFKRKHPGHYKIYNLCIERSYNEACFENVNQDFVFYDHNPPPFDMIFAFCLDLDVWLKKDEKNVAAIHCKAGKGRTGVMICCYLVFSKYCNSTDDALKYYAKIRTKDNKGITIPS
jgi:phosphatidylinositol-3,4,5-trisphosphate 3-phosphatase/dual-specificity protein phosphatase PTEN